MTTRSVAIAGAGIAGLTAALALAGKNIEVDILEQTGALDEVGAGLQLSPNASRILDRLGILTEIEKVWVEPDDIRLVSGTDLRPVATVPAGQFARTRWKAPYGVLHRAALQRVLLSAVEKNPLCRLHLGQRLTTNDKGAIAALTGTRPDLVVGADGVWSAMRACVPGSAQPRFSGHVAWRFLADAPQPSGSFLSTRAVTAFLGPRAHLVAYPLNGSGLFNIVAIVQGDQRSRGWSHPAGPPERDALLKAFSGWDAAIVALLAGASQPTHWPLYDLAEGSWHDGASTILIGDAAHAMMPFAAQGAAMAIEDGFELAGLVSAHPLPEAFLAFENRRRARIQRVRARAGFNRFAYHARGPVRIARDLVLSLRSPESLAADFDWLYGYEPRDG